MSNVDNTLVLVLSRAIEQNKFADALAVVKGLPPVDVADVLEQLDPVLGWRLLECLPNRADVFSYFEPEQQVRMAREFPRATLAELVSEMPADERTDLFKRFDQNQRDILLPALAHAQREDIRRLSAYVEGTAGALMTSDYATLNKDMTVAQAMRYLRDEAPDAETIYQAYVIDEQRRLLGAVSLRDLILADLHKSIQDLMTSDVVSAHVTDDQEDIAKKIARYDLLALPIIDEDDILIGMSPMTMRWMWSVPKRPMIFINPLVSVRWWGILKMPALPCCTANGFSGWYCWCLVICFLARVLPILKTSSQPILF